MSILALKESMKDQKMIEDIMMGVIMIGIIRRKKESFLIFKFRSKVG